MIEKELILFGVILLYHLKGSPINSRTASCQIQNPYFHIPWFGNTWSYKVATIELIDS